MGFLSAMKANKAHRMQQNGQREEAAKLYEEAFAEGLKEPRFLLAYALMIIRDGKYQKAKEFLVKHQKVPMAPGQRVELLVYYATCCFRLGNTDKGIDVLEQQFRKTETGLLYQTLGYLYVDKYDLEHRPDFEAMKAEAAQAAAGNRMPAEETQAKRKPGGDRKKRKRLSCPRRKRGTRALKKPSSLSAIRWNMTMKILSAWTTSGNSCTGYAATKKPRRSGLTRRSPGKKTRLTRCIS